MITLEELRDLALKCKRDEQILAIVDQYGYNSPADRECMGLKTLPLIRSGGIITTWGTILTSSDIINAKIVKKEFFKKMRKVSQSKKPKERTDYVGIELEFISELTIADLELKLAEHDLEQYVTLKEDGSVEGTEMYPHAHEICILAKESEMPKIVKRVCKILQHNSTVNSTCGMHVHVDMRLRDHSQAFANLWASQKLLYSLVPSSRRYNDYCEFLDEYWHFVDKHDTPDSRYYGINTRSYADHKTLEIRIHTGTLNANKIINWVKLLIAIADGSAVSTDSPKLISEYKEVKKLFKITRSVDAYVKKRLVEFKSNHPVQIAF